MPLSEAQLAMRLTGLGSSDIGQVAGLSPHGGPMDVYLTKTGLAEVVETAPMRAGRHLEAAVAAMYAEDTGAHLAECTTLAHPTEPWILATPDRFVLGPDGRPERLLEIKCVGLHARAAWGDAPDGVPEHYLAQTCWQLGVTGLPACDVAALIGGQDLRVYTVAFDEGLFEALVNIGRRFWFDHVVPQVPPPLDGSEAARTYLAATYSRHGRELRPAPPSAERWATELAEAKRTLAAAQARADLAQTHLCAAIGDAAGIEGATWKATWKAPARGTPRWKDLALALGATPDLIATHTSAPARRFLFTTTETTPEGDD